MELADKFFALKEKKDQINADLKEVNEQLAEVELSLVSWLENNKLEKITTSEGSLFSKEIVYASIEDTDKAFSWLRANGLGDIIKETIHSKTLSSTVKEQGEIPGVKATIETQIGFRRVSKKEAA